MVGRLGFMTLHDLRRYLHNSAMPGPLTPRHKCTQHGVRR